MTVRWTARARNDLQEIRRYIAADSPEAAARLVQEIVSNTKNLSRFPESGRVVPESVTPDIREVIAPPYRVLYAIRKNSVHVLGIIHGKRAMSSVLKQRSDE